MLVTPGINNITICCVTFSILYISPDFYKKKKPAWICSSHTFNISGLLLYAEYQINGWSELFLQLQCWILLQNDLNTCGRAAPVYQ